MEKKKLEKYQQLFNVTCLVGLILFMIANGTGWLNFIEERIRILLLSLIVAISFLGMLVSSHRLELIRAYEKGIEEEKTKHEKEVKDNDPNSHK